ncbi:DUF1194 domain-containing protein [Anianabacter salinae]|uniref:DUF1194 domain-containing protein n=1 Tax=Anianabacter salinae TaxID=2851023 RepID=UPI00225DEEB2|nr:DUF1194 domain-containing protein [Anianabacter salinae]MBV0912555.1 DUF1194 domain-containing protein [Anianabacter salinae]
MKRLVCAAVLALAPLAASAECRLALALGLDVSGSVDAEEYRLQLDGLAGALLRPDVAEAILAMPDAPMRLFVYEWSGAASQRILIPWTEIADEAGLRAIAGRLTGAERAALDLSTGIGQAMLFGQTATRRQAECWRRTLDLSGDGESNSGPRPREVRDALGDLTVNGLVIGTPRLAETGDSAASSLRRYFESEVIRGPDAFVEVARGYEAFEDTMARKLLKEIQILAFSDASGDQ